MATIPLPKNIDDAFSTVSRRVHEAKKATGDAISGEHGAEWGAINVAIGELFYQVETCLKDLELVRHVAACASADAIEEGRFDPEAREIESTYDGPFDVIHTSMARAWEMRPDDSEDCA